MSCTTNSNICRRQACHMLFYDDVLKLISWSSGIKINTLLADQRRWFSNEDSITEARNGKSSMVETIPCMMKGIQGLEEAQ